MSIHIRTKELSKLGFTDNVSRSLITNIIGKHCKHETKDEVITNLMAILENPQHFADHEKWAQLAQYFLPSVSDQPFTSYDLRTHALGFKQYGGKHIESSAKQQMEMAMRLPISLQGALMPDAHAGYGLPIGGVLATQNVVIPYAVGMDIGCSMRLSIFDVSSQHLQRYAYQIKTALKQFTHFGIDGDLGFEQDHAITDHPGFELTPLLRQLKGKAIRQLGSSGSGNHFVEFGEMSICANNPLHLPEGNYMALLSHSGSRGLGASIARQYTDIAREVCRLPREAGHFAWLDMDSEAGQEYWLSMLLAGDYAEACHEQIHHNLSKALGLKIVAKVHNCHNFAWKEQLSDGTWAIVHRKGATPAHVGELGFIPGNMIAPGYLVSGKGVADALCSASHGAGRALSRKRAKESFTQSELKKKLTQAGVTLMGGSVEEAPLAYKDIDKVMESQTALVDIHGRFQPRIVRMNKE